MGSTGVGASASERETRQQSRQFAQELVAAGPRTVVSSTGVRTPSPPPRPDIARDQRSPIGQIGQDINMGVQSLLGRREESGYTPAQWQAYDIRTAQTKARMAAEADSGDDDDDEPAPAKPAEPAAPEPTAPAETVTQPTQIETAQADLTKAVDELTMDPGERAARERAAGTPEMDLGTAAGAAAERAAAEKTAASQAEKEAADALLKGRRSTILTTPGGLLAPAEEQTTRTRSLIGGRSRA
jgi:hypothetical protein